MDNQNQTTQTSQAKPNQPATEPADRMLAKIGDFIRKYLVCDDEQIYVLCIWILHTWMVRALPNTPYLNIQSPGPHCGKTRCLKLLQLFSPAGSWFTSAPTQNLFMKRLLELKPAENPADKPTEDSAGKPPANPADQFVHNLPSVVFLDDREFTIGRSDRNPIIPFLLNGFHATSRYLYQHERSSMREFSVFCPKAFAGVAPLPPKLNERCIPIDLKRKLKSDKVEDFQWSYATATARPLLDWLKQWSEENFKCLAARCNLMAMTPSERFNVREAEFVRPLLILADLVSDTWRSNVGASLQWLKLRSGIDTSSENIKLLHDVRDIFNDHQHPAYIPTKDLIAELKDIELRPWAAWTGSAPHKLARLLRPFGIRSSQQRISANSGLKVYREEDFQDAWNRYYY